MVGFGEIDEFEVEGECARQQDRTVNRKRVNKFKSLGALACSFLFIAACLGIAAANGSLAQCFDVGKEVFYALDEDEKEGVLDRIAAEKKRGNVMVQRFKGLGEMNPMQLRETTMDPDTRRLVQLTLDQPKKTDEMLDMLLAKKRSGDRKSWLEAKGDQATIA